jgi:hypothetical protein
MNYPKSWLEGVPVSTTAYVFQSAFICEDCGRARIEQLRSNGVEDDGDPDTFPQGPYGDGGGEADTAQFCDNRRDCVNAVEVDGHKISCPLGNPLTSHGAESLRKSVRDDLLAPDKRTRLIGRLLCHVWKDFTETPLVRLPPRATSSKLLEKHLAYLRKDEHAEISPVMFTDLEHVYGIATNPSKTIAWRITCTDEGGLTDLSVVYLPASEVTERGVEDVVREAALADAWD